MAIILTAATEDYRTKRAMAKIDDDKASFKYLGAFLAKLDLTGTTMKWVENGASEPLEPDAVLAAIEDTVRLWKTILELSKLMKDIICSIYNIINWS